MPIGSIKAAMFGASNLLGEEDLPTLIEDVSFSGATTGVSSTLSLSSYQKITLDIHLTASNDDNNTIALQVSDDDGVTWDGTTDYHSFSHHASDGGFKQERNQAGTTRLFFLHDSTSWGMGNGAADGLFVQAEIFAPAGSDDKAMLFNSHMVGPTAGNGTIINYGGGRREITSAIDKIRLISTDGNIAGNMYIYGWPNT